MWMHFSWLPMLSPKPLKPELPPVEVCTNIFSYLTWRESLRIRSTCHKLNLAFMQRIPHTKERLRMEKRYSLPRGTLIGSKGLILKPWHIGLPNKTSFFFLNDRLTLTDPAFKPPADQPWIVELSHQMINLQIYLNRLLHYIEDYPNVQIRTLNVANNNLTSIELQTIFSVVDRTFLHKVRKEFATSAYNDDSPWAKSIRVALRDARQRIRQLDYGMAPSLRHLVALNIDDSLLGQNLTFALSTDMLERCFFCQSFTKALASLPKLEWLSAKRCQLDMYHAQDIARIKTLRYLDLEENELGDTGALMLTKLPCLYFLNIARNDVFTLTIKSFLPIRTVVLAPQ